jgi:hypothetical protein
LESQEGDALASGMMAKDSVAISKSGTMRSAMGLKFIAIVRQGLQKGAINSCDFSIYAYEFQIHLS